MNLISSLLIIFLSLMIFLEIRHRLKSSSPLVLKASKLITNEHSDGLDFELLVKITNPHQRMEVMIPDIKVNTILLGGIKNLNTHLSSEIHQNNTESEKREDGYWPATIVKAKSQLEIKLKLKLRNKNLSISENLPKNIWVEVCWVNYGPFGKIERKDGILIPINKPLNNKLNIIKEHRAITIPIKTHLLGVFDNPNKICVDYVKSHLEPGDILTIGETPLAVMQGRYVHPICIEPDFLSRTLCRLFHPTSSLATACGMQVLINIVGPSRVLIAFIIGSLLKSVGMKGYFYRIAGEQARLIDDITGTTPPYDKTIVLGPTNTENICIEISRVLGIEVAIVDVNDLGRVKILASSNKNINALLLQALRKNPAGNSNEQTPLVLVRPS